MKEFDKLIIYICLMVVAIIIALPAYITGAIDLMVITTLGAFLMTLLYMEFIMKDEEDEYYED